MARTILLGAFALLLACAGPGRARLLRASGAPIDGRGVTPDVVIEAGAPPILGPLPSDVACAGFASPAPVAGDPAVARGVALLLGGP